MSAKHLIIIAGVSSAGKSSLITRLTQGSVPDLGVRLGMDSPSHFSYCNGKGLLEQTESLDDKVILHYDFLYLSSSQHDLRFLPDVVRNRANITVLTLCASAEELQYRMLFRFYRALRQFCFRPDTFKGKRLLRIYRTKNIYNDMDRILSFYRAWSEGLLQEMSIDKHLLLDSSVPDIGRAEVYNLRSVAEILEQAAC